MGGSTTVTRKCPACDEGRHDDCIDNVPIHDGADAAGFIALCGCQEGECAPMLSLACVEWLHNCPGCPCACHEDPELRDAWSKVHRVQCAVCEGAGFIPTANGYALLGFVRRYVR